MITPVAPCFFSFLLSLIPLTCCFMILFLTGSWTGGSRRTCAIKEDGKICVAVVWEIEILTGKCLVHVRCINFLKMWSAKLRAIENVKEMKCFTIPESSRLPLLWLWFDSRTRRHMWVAFFGSLLCTERFFSGYSGFPSPQKPILTGFLCICKVSPISAAISAVLEDLTLKVHHHQWCWALLVTQRRILDPFWSLEVLKMLVPLPLHEYYLCHVEYAF